MRVTRLVIENFRGISHSELHFEGHTLLVGPNNVGKSTVCEALELALGPERLNRNPPVGEYDFYNAAYMDGDGAPLPLRIEVVLTDLSSEMKRRCAINLEHWKKDECRLLGEGELETVDTHTVDQCLRIQTIGRYNHEEDEFEGRSYYLHSPDTAEGEPRQVPREVKRLFGFLYLRALRTGSRAFSFEKGSLLDIILRMKEARTGLWEPTRQRFRKLDC